jgi:hypothetical protein
VPDFERERESGETSDIDEVEMDFKLYDVETRVFGEEGGEGKDLGRSDLILVFMKSFRTFLEKGGVLDDEER